MSTYTVPDGVDVPSEVGATIDLAVPGELEVCGSCNGHDIARSGDVGSPCYACNGGANEIPPPVLAALVQKKCETPECRGGEIQYPEWEGRTEPCPACAGSGFDLLDLVRECDHSGLAAALREHKRLIDRGLFETPGEAYRKMPPPCQRCRNGTVSLGRWKVEALLPVVRFGDWDTTRSAVVLDDVGYAMLAIVTDGIVDSRGLTVHGKPEPGGYVATLTLVTAP